MIHYVACIFGIACLGLAPAKNAGVTAEKWLNRLTICHADPRTHVILFFDLSHPKELKQHVERLNRLARRSDVLVLGVTPAREKKGRQFLKQFRPRFAVGVQSLSYKSFDVKRFPTIVVVNDENRETFEVFEEWGELDELLGPAPEDVLRGPEELSIDELQAKVKEEGSAALGLLEHLRIRMPPEEFLQFCDDIKNNPEPRWLGPLYYQRHLADPEVSEKQPPTTPAIDAVRMARREGDRKVAEWRELLKTKATWSDDEVFDLYQRYSGDSFEDLVYRSDLTHALAETRNRSYVNPLLDMLDVEPDGGIRFRIITAIGGLYGEGALSAGVIERLEAHSAVEDNIAWARPMLEFTLKHQRNPATKSNTHP